MQQPAAAHSPTTTFSILGPLQATIDGAPVHLGGPRQIAVLARLLLSPGQVVSMGQLVESVWDGLSPARPEVTIRSYISNLRRSIEPGRHRGDPRSCIESKAPGYRLAVEPDQVDAVRFERLVVEGRRALTAGQHRVAVEKLHEARALWRGEPCEGALETDALLAFRARLTELHLGGAEAMFEARIDLGEHDAIIPDLEAEIARNPLRERLSELSMRALYAAGRQSDSLAVCRQLRQRLVEQLGVDPGPRVQELERKILSHDASLNPPQPEVMRQFAAEQAADDDPIVGRHDELLALLQVGVELERGRSGSALITGEPGSGKTTMALEAGRQLSKAGVRVVWGRCRPVAVERMLWPWSQMLHDLVDVVEPAMMIGVEPVVAIAPALATRTGGPVPPAPMLPADPGEASTLFQPVVELIRRVATTRPLVLILDDVHWADTATTELLSYAGAALTTSRVGLVVTWRDTEPADRSSRRALRGLARLPSTTRVELGGVDLRAAEQLVEHHGGDAELARRLHWASAGNPLLIRELTANIGPPATGTADTRGPEIERLEPNSTVCDVLLDRVERVHPRAVEVLAVAALAERSFSAEIVAEGGGFAPVLVDEILDGAVDAGLLVGGPERAYLFVHPIAQTVLADELPTPRRARLHATIGQAMWRAGWPAADLAHHFSRAGSAGTSILAARFALEATTGLSDPARLAMAEQAAADGLAALDRLDRSDGLEAELATLLAQLARLRGDADRFARLADHAVEAAERTGDDDQLADAVLAVTGPNPAMTGPAAVDWIGCRREPGPALDRVDGLLDRLPGHHRARPALEARRAVLLALGGVDSPGSRPPVAGPGSTAAEPGAPVAVTAEHARLLLGRGTAQQRLDAADQLSPAGDDTPALPHCRLLATRLRLLAQLELGAPADAETLLADTRASLAADDGLSSLELDVIEIEVALVQGRLGDAADQLIVSRRRCRAAGLSTTTSFDRQLAALRWIQGDLDEAERLALAAHAGSGIGDEVDRLVIRSALAAHRHDRAETVRLLDELVVHDGWPGVVVDHPFLERSALVAVAADHADHRVAAEPTFEHLAAQPKSFVSGERGSLVTGPAAYHAALAARALGRGNTAHGLLAEAERQCRAAQARTCLVLTLVAQAGSGPGATADPAEPGDLDLDLRVSGLPTVASVRLGEAKALAEEIEMDLLAVPGDN